MIAQRQTHYQRHAARLAIHPLFGGAHANFVRRSRRFGYADRARLNGPLLQGRISRPPFDASPLFAHSDGVGRLAAVIAHL